MLRLFSSGGMWSRGQRVMVMCRRMPSYTLNASRQMAVECDRKPLLDLTEADIYSPEDVRTASRRAIRAINFIRSALKAHTSGKHPLSVQLRLQLLDAVSNELCLAIDSAEFIRNAHTDSTFTQAADDSFSELSALISDLNADSSLYLALQAIVDDKSVFSSLQAHDQQFALALLQDFKMEGVHLPPDQKDQLHHLNFEVSQYETIWSQQIMHSPLQPSDISSEEEYHENYLELGPFVTTSNKSSDTINHFHSLSQWLQRGVIAQPKDLVASSTLLIPRDQRVLGTLTNSVDQEHLRKELWFNLSLSPISNLSTLRDLVQSRTTAARFLGYQDSVTKILSKHVAQEPSAVRSLVKVLSDAARPFAQQELESLAQLKQLDIDQQEDDSWMQKTSGGVLSSLFSSPSKSKKSQRNTQSLAQLQPWDLGYYQNLQRSSQSAKAAQSEFTRAASQVRDYLSVSNCLEGLKYVTESLFGVHLERQSMQPGESWLVAQQRNVGNRSEYEDNALVKYQLFDGRKENPNEKGELLGTVYLDLFQRPQKFTGAAHFTVRCGCSSVVYPNASATTVGTDSITLPADYNVQNWRSTTQTPIVALVFPFAASKASSSSLRKIDLTQQCLSLSDLESLFHEWGHALHSLLSRTQYQHLSGTRGPTDFIEIPSHLFEYYARSPQILQRFARHRITQTAIPPELLTAALAAQKTHRGIDLQNQILLTLADQHLLSDPALLNAALDRQQVSSGAFYRQAMHGIANLQQEFTDLPIATVSVDELQQLPTHHVLHALFDDHPQDYRTLCLPSVNMLYHRHFVGYAGSYYAYLYAKVVAAQVWDRLFAQDALCPEQGRFLREQLLRPGCSESPQRVLRSLLGTPNRNHVGNSSGNSSSMLLELDAAPYLRTIFGEQ